MWGSNQVPLAYQVSALPLYHCFWYNIQGAPYVLDHYISLHTGYNLIFFVLFLICRILARFRGLFWHTVLSCNIIGWGFIWENIKKKIMEKMEKWSNYQGPKSDLKLGTIIEIFFYVKFGIFWFWGIDNLQKKFGSFILFVNFSLLSNFC